jgi:hypothetical protein
MFDTAAQREIGPYAVHELIGWSGMARVYRATDTSREEAEVAIKVLNDSFINDVEYEQRFMREIEIAGTLYHPHILAVLGYGRNLGLPFMMIFFSFIHWLPLSLLVMVGMGLGFMLAANTTNALVQTQVQDELRGRVMGVYTLIFFGAMPVGSLLAGLLASRLG